MYWSWALELCNPRASEAGPAGKPLRYLCRLVLRSSVKRAEGAGRQLWPGQIDFWPSAAAVRSAVRPWLGQDRLRRSPVTPDLGARNRWVSPAGLGSRGHRSSRGRVPGSSPLAETTPGPPRLWSTRMNPPRLDPVPLPCHTVSPAPPRSSSAARASASSPGLDLTQP